MEVSKCTAIKCVFRTMTSENRAYCPFAKCPFGQRETYIVKGRKDNDVHRVSKK